METLNLRWEELGIKEEQLKAHIQKFEQFIQVQSRVVCSGWRLYTVLDQMVLPPHLTS